MSARLLVSEIFGPTIQGEGLGLGLPAMFLRLAGCPLECSWCDTTYAWNWQKFDKRTHSEQLSATAVWDRVLALAEGSAVTTLVVTGGEPASQASALFRVVQAAAAADWRVEMETSGVVDPGPLTPSLDLLTVSPKLASAGMSRARRYRAEVLHSLAARDNAVFKFVIDDESDLAEADEIVASLRLAPSRVLLMGQADDAQGVLQQTRWLVAAAIERGYRITPRLHTLLWGNQRGR